MVGRITHDATEWDVNSPADMRGIVLMRGKNVDDLRNAGRADRRELLMFDLAHCYWVIAARAVKAVSTIVSPLPAAILAVSTS
jgi:hypothetical protein